MSYNKRVTVENKIRAWSLNNWDDEKGLKIGGLAGVWKVFEDLEVLGEFQRRGVHVSIPKIGSRDGLKCFGGILGFCAELRREWGWGN
jgi:hypothetical protein